MSEFSGRKPATSKRADVTIGPGRPGPQLLFSKAPLQGMRAAALAIGLLATTTACVSLQPSLGVEEFLVDRMAEAGVPGLAAGLIREGRLVEEYYLGLADVPTGTPVDADTVFMIASMSKPVTATAVMILVQRGQVDLDAPVDRYLPIPVTHPRHPEVAITPRMLLTHTASIRDADGAYDGLYTLPEGGDPTMSLAALATAYFTPRGELYDERRNFGRWAPGTRHEYSNMGFALAGYLVESVSGVDFAEFCDREIFEPLGMEDTGWFLRDVEGKSIATPNVVRRTELRTLPHYGYASYPDGQLRSTVRDYARFMAAFMDPVTPGILDPATRREVLRVQYPEIHDGQMIAWNANELELGFLFPNVPHLPAHSGGDYGVRSSGMFDPESGTGLLFFANGSRNTMRATRAVYFDIPQRLAAELGLR